MSDDTNAAVFCASSSKICRSSAEGAALSRGAARADDADGAGSSVLTLRLAGGVDSLTMVKTRDEVKLVMALAFQLSGHRRAEVCESGNGTWLEVMAMMSRGYFEGGMTGGEDGAGGGYAA